MAEQMTVLSKKEKEVLAKLLGNMTQAQWRAFGQLDSYECQVLWMTYRNLVEDDLYV